MKNRYVFAMLSTLAIAVIGTAIFCTSCWTPIEYSAIVGYGFKGLTWTREDMGRIVYDDDHIKDRLGELLSPCSYDDFKTNVLSRLRCTSGRAARKTCEYERLFKELSIHIGFANVPGKRVAVFSLKAYSAEDVVPFLDACAEAVVDMYPISQNARFERSVSSISNIVQKQERTVQRLKEKMKRSDQSSGESAVTQSPDIEMAQKLYNDLKQKLEETEKFRNTVPYKIQVIKHTAEKSCHVTE